MFVSVCVCVICKNKIKNNQTFFKLGANKESTHYYGVVKLAETSEYIYHAL